MMVYLQQLPCADSPPLDMADTAPPAAMLTKSPCTLVPAACLMLGIHIDLEAGAALLDQLDGVDAGHMSLYNKPAIPTNHKGTISA